VVASLDRGLAPTFGDVSALEQVLLNLITNARQAMEGAGEIRVVTRPAPAHPGWIELVVSDTGPGIPAEIVSKIFDPFFTTKASGTGLGLSITQRIVQEHGGVIEVAASRGAGPVFVI
jgi:two-component system, NtrC family, sensor kinase